MRGRTRGAVRRGSPWLGLCPILGADGANWSMRNRLRLAADRERQDRAPCVGTRRCNGLPKFADSTNFNPLLQTRYTAAAKLSDIRQMFNSRLCKCGIRVGEINGINSSEHKCLVQWCNW